MTKREKVMLSLLSVATVASIVNTIVVITHTDARSDAASSSETFYDAKTDEYKKWSDYSPAEQAGIKTDLETVDAVRVLADVAIYSPAAISGNWGQLNNDSLNYTSLDKNIQWKVIGDDATNGYCVIAYNSFGRDYSTLNRAFTYDSTGGGLGAVDGSCALYA